MNRLVSHLRSPGGASVVLALLLAAMGCGDGGSQKPGANSPGLNAARRPDGTIIDDRSLCLSKETKGLESSETAGPGAFQPNVRRVWKVLGTDATQRKVLVCREIDTNLDGIKDVARTYTDQGQSKEEKADTNYDGKLDTWIVFAKGRLVEVRHDHNGDGEVDEWKFFRSGQLNRVKRDTNFDHKPNVWEIYRKGRLERMGIDETGDGRVDRWDKDTEWRRRLDRAEKLRREAEEKRKKEKQEAAGAGGGGGGGSGGSADDSESGDSGESSG